MEDKGGMIEKYVIGCTRKIPYFSDAEARQAIKGWKDKTTKPKLYLCLNIDMPKHWHITSMSKEKYKSKKKYLVKRI
jgi:hypothetical protein